MTPPTLNGTAEKVRPAGTRTGIGKAILKLAGLHRNGESDLAHDLAQRGHQDGYRNGQSDGVHDGTSDGNCDGNIDGNTNNYDIFEALASDSTVDLRFYLDGDSVVPLPAGYRPEPSATEHAREFLHYLQQIEELPGRWILTRHLQTTLYPRFLAQIGWSPQPWRTVAHHFAKLKGLKKRQQDRRPTGFAGWQYFIPRRQRR
jgi:hypothetical protein